MIVERKNNEVIIRLPGNVDIDDLQDMINYARYKEITTKFDVVQDDVDQLAADINKDWWTRNRGNFIK